MDPELSLAAYQKADNSAMWMLENLLDLGDSRRIVVLRGRLPDESIDRCCCPTNARRRACARGLEGWAVVG